MMAENYPPYSYEVDGLAEGLISDIVHIIQEQVGEQSSKITFYPWARSYQNLQDGTSDVLFPMARTPEREKLFKFVGPVATSVVYLYRKKETDVYVDSVEEAKRVGRIGVTRNDIFHQLLVKWGFANLDVSSSRDSDFRKLYKGRVDLVPLSEYDMYHFFQNIPDLDESMFEKAGRHIYTVRSYIAFGTHVPDAVVLKWQKSLDAIKESGVYQDIINSYYDHLK
ncbi:MAG: hypothetical protein BA863_01495 [Desulfovibrio sp. S3730MH75]|nr:MAG: hypothetical protein BA863_01495 [Desulfovibrio sp. S3730MH75]